MEIQLSERHHKQFSSVCIQRGHGRRLLVLSVLLATSCTVPSLDELYAECDQPFDAATVIDGKPADVLMGNKSSCRSIKATVEFKGFVPGCLVVRATDTKSGKELTQNYSAPVGQRPASIHVAVLPPSGWGVNVEVSTEAFERQCEGKVIDSSTRSAALAYKKQVPIALSVQALDVDQDGYVGVTSGGTDCSDGNPRIHPGAEERCNDTDDNCDGVTDEVHFMLNQECSLSADCKGIFRCNPVTQTLSCDSPTAKTVYPDADGDKYGQKGSEGRIICSAVPAGYTDGPPTDCRDDAFSINPGAQDLCDGEDNNCDGTSDESFPSKGQTCTNVPTQCEGTQQCSADKQRLECVSSPAPKWYLDEDGDGYGGVTSVESCVKPTGPYVQQPGDCDDGNPYTNPGAPEICDDLDNNCDAVRETVAQCPGQAVPTWVLKTVESDSTWLSASSWGTRTTGGVWVAGTNNRLARMTFPEMTFTVLAATNCGALDTVWSSVWGDPTNGQAWLGSQGGKKGYLPQSSTNCVAVHDDNLEIFGLVGLRVNNVLSLYGASASTAAGEGLAFTWDGSGLPTYNSASNVLSEVFDVHAHSPEHVLVVGGVSAIPRARIYRFEPSSRRWTQETVPNGDRLRGVWVVNDRVAFAVGDAGTVLRKTNGTQWVAISKPPDIHNLTSVIAFGANSAYATCTNGHIYRFNGTSWTRVYSGNLRFNDITGTGPDDIWAVGNSGRIVRWPYWP
ncbi:hypothetical protein WA016_00610 [Myxococcus stipitatus]